jgi:hypothetical protein
MLRRITVNFIVDFVSFLDLLGLIFTGIIIRYILPPGTGGRGQELHGGQGAGRVKDFWTMTRHEWGDVHFYMVVVFIVLMLIHLFLHWTWIKCYIKSLFGTKKST